MGPPPFGDGNRGVRGLFAVGRLDASMGPPPFGDGNSPSAVRAWGCSRCFNGATAFRRWKPCLSAARRDFPGRFNGATAFRRWKHVYNNGIGLPLYSLQWGHRLSAMETMSCRGCQGLSSMLQWGHRLSAMETALAGQVKLAELVASMGPPPFGDGNSGQRPRPSRSTTRFNGATAFRRWKLWATATSFTLDHTLQWGHRLSAMETWARRTR